jgi:hypothetical protein
LEDGDASNVEAAASMTEGVESNVLPVVHISATSIEVTLGEAVAMIEKDEIEVLALLAPSEGGAWRTSPAVQSSGTFAGKEASDEKEAPTRLEKQTQFSHSDLPSTGTQSIPPATKDMSVCCCTHCHLALF